MSVHLPFGHLPDGHLPDGHLPGVEDLPPPGGGGGMATCLITEGQFGKYGMQVMRPHSTQAVTFTTSTQSSAFAGTTNLVRIIADADVFLAFGANPTATATAVKMAANTVEYFEVAPGEKIACYDGAS